MYPYDVVLDAAPQQVLFDTSVTVIHMYNMIEYSCVEVQTMKHC